MKIINARKFNDIDDWLDKDTLEEIQGYESGVQDNFEVYDAEANEADLPILEIDEDDEEAMGYLADNYVQTEEPLSVIDDTLQEVGDFRRMQEGLPEEEPDIKTREEVEQEDIVDESVAEETEPDTRVKDFATPADAVRAAMEERRVLEIFYVTKGRGSRNEDRYLKRERGLQRTDTGGVHIHRIVEPHHMYMAGNGNEVVVTYDRSVRRIRAFIIANIYDYNFTQNRKTKEDQYFKPRARVMPSSGKGIKTMKNINDKLTKIASTLDNKGLKKSSLVIRSAIKAANDYKMAQYIGVQGYWLKNRRCWDNCYRNKRTSKPGTSAQEVWMECWDEYKDSINNEKSTWAKYAKVDASVKLTKEQQKKWNKIFADKVDEKVSSGLSRPEAIYAIIEAETNEYTSKIIQASSDLMVLAETLSNNGHKEIGEEMAKVSMEMLKETEFQGQQQNWVGRGVDKVKNFFSGFKGKNDATDVAAKLQDVVNRVNDLIDMLDNPGNYVKQTKQTSQTNGFIIEAGKGMKIVEAYNKYEIEPNVWWSNPDNANTDEFKNWAVENPEYQQSHQYKMWARENPEKAQAITPTSPYVDQSKLAPGQHFEDTTGKGGYDVQGEQTQPQTQPPAPAPEQVRIEGLNTKHQALMSDVKSLVGDLTGLLNSPDPQVSQYAKGAVPLLQTFLGTTSQLRGMDITDRNASFRASLSELATNLQGVLGGMPQQPGLGNQLGVGNQPVGTVQQPAGAVQQQVATPQNLSAIPSLVKTIAAIPNAGPKFIKSLQSNSLSIDDLGSLIQAFESRSIPFTTDNWNQFKNQMVAAVPNK